MTLKTHVWRAFKDAQNERIIIGQHVVINSHRIFRRHTEASATFIENAEAADVFVIREKSTVVFSTGAAGADAGLDPVA